MTGIASRFLAAALLIVAGLGAPAAASPLTERIWLQSYLTYPIEDVPFTAAAMGYLGHVKEVIADFTIRGPGGAPLMSRRTVTDFDEDGRAADEVDTDLLLGGTAYRATYRYNAKKQIALITRENYDERRTDTIAFDYDAKGLLVGASFTRNGEPLKRIAIVDDASGRPLSAATILPDGRTISRVTYAYAAHSVTVAYSGDFGAAHVISTFQFDAQGRPLTAETQRRDVEPQVDYDGAYRYTYLADGEKLFHGVEFHPNALPHPTRCVFDREFFANGGAKHSAAEGDGVTCQNGPSASPEAEFDAAGNFTHTRLGPYEHTYRITYFAAPSM
jgi:hypothetical protein